jgi:hypothetical protein
MVLFEILRFLRLVLSVTISKSFPIAKSLPSTKLNTAYCSSRLEESLLTASDSQVKVKRGSGEEV